MKKEFIFNKVPKRLLTSVLALTMVATALPITAYADGEVNGTGTAEDPYIVDTEAELNEAISKGSTETVYVSLEDDITVLNRVNITDKSVDLNLSNHAIIASDELKSTDGRNNVVEINNTTLDSGSMIVNIHDGSIIGVVNICAVFKPTKLRSFC